MNLNIEILSKAADQARGLCMDAVQASQSGHLAPLGCAEIGAVLFGHALRYNPDQPRWINRDIFVLSAGHGQHVPLCLAAHERLRFADVGNRNVFGNCIRKRRDTPSLARRPEWNAPPDRLARASATQLAVSVATNMARHGSTPMSTRFSTSTCLVCAVTATCRKTSSEACALAGVGSRQSDFHFTEFQCRNAGCAPQHAVRGHRSADESIRL